MRFTLGSSFPTLLLLLLGSQGSYSQTDAESFCIGENNTEVNLAAFDPIPEDLNRCDDEFCFCVYSPAYFEGLTVGITAQNLVENQLCPWELPDYPSDSDPYSGPGSMSQNFLKTTVTGGFGEIPDNTTVCLAGKSDYRFSQTTDECTFYSTAFFEPNGPSGQEPLNIRVLEGFTLCPDTFASIVDDSGAVSWKPMVAILSVIAAGWLM